MALSIRISRAAQSLLHTLPVRTLQQVHGALVRTAAQVEEARAGGHPFAAPVHLLVATAGLWLRLEVDEARASLRLMAVSPTARPASGDTRGPRARAVAYGAAAAPLA
jgi:hypothetical protein